MSAVPSADGGGLVCEHMGRVAASECCYRGWDGFGKLRLKNPLHLKLLDAIQTAIDFSSLGLTD